MSQKCFKDSVPALTTADTEGIMVKYAISLPRGYFDGISETLKAAKSNIERAASKALEVGGDALDAAEAVEDYILDQVAKLMGFEFVEVVEVFGNDRTASITVFNPQTDDASEIKLSIADKTASVVGVENVIHLSESEGALEKVASFRKQAGIIVKKIIRQRKYKHGYIIRDEYWAMSDDDPEEEWTLMEKMAYTPCGEYIGDSKTAYYLCKTMGIIPRVAGPEHTVCSIGYNPVKKKWYGWSHRAICGFGIGDKVFDPEYGNDSTPYNRHGEKIIDKMEDAMQAAIAFANYVS